MSMLVKYSDTKVYLSPYHFLREYAKQDSRIVVDALISLCKTLRELGFALPISKSITTPAVCISIFKAYFNAPAINPIMQIQMGTSTYNFLNKAYIGGRVEVFNRGLGIDKVYHFDVPGLYANIMCKALPISPILSPSHSAFSNILSVLFSHFNPLSLLKYIIPSLLNITNLIIYSFLTHFIL